MSATSAAQAKLLEMLDGYRVVQTLYVAAQLDIADLLRNGPQHCRALSTATGAHERSLKRLLRALACLDVIREEEDGRFALTETGRLLRSDVSGSLRNAVVFYGGRRHWTAWGQLLETVKSGRTVFGTASPEVFADLATRDTAGAIAFNEAMVALSGPINECIVDMYDFSNVDTLVDVGGGFGALITAVLAAYPRLRGILLDIAPVIDVARVRIDSALADRCELVAGDFFATVPPGAGAYILKWVLHDWDDDQCRTLLKCCRSAMRADSRLLLIERVVPERADALPAASSKFLSDLNMMLLSGGCERTEEEYRALLETGGFDLKRIIPTRTPHSIIEATLA